MGSNQKLPRYVFVLRTYNNEGYFSLVHHLTFDFSDDGWWGAKMLCTGAIVDGGKLPVRDEHFHLELVVTCLTCLASAGPMQS